MFNLLFGVENIYHTKDRSSYALLVHYNASIPYSLIILLRNEALLYTWYKAMLCNKYPVRTIPFLHNLSVCTVNTFLVPLGLLKKCLMSDFFYDTR